MTLLEQMQQGDQTFWALIGAAGSGLLLAIIAGFKTLINQYSKRLSNKIENQIKLENAETQIEIEQKKKEAEKEEVIKEDKKKSRSVIQQGLLIASYLDELRNYCNASVVTLAKFHNGLFKNFKQQTVLFESYRDISFSRVDGNRSKNLSPYYPVLNAYESIRILDVTVEDERAAVTDKIISELKEDDYLRRISIPVLIDKQDIWEDSLKLLEIERFEISYYLIGSLEVYLDEESDFEVLKDMDKFMSIMEGKLDDIMSLFREHDYKTW